MKILPRFRTILAVLLTVAVTLAGGVLSLTTYYTMLGNLRYFADEIAIEISVGGKAQIETIVEHSEKAIRLVGNFLAARIHDPALPFIVSKLWHQSAIFKNKNNALRFVEPAQGKGFIIYADDAEVVGPDSKGGFLARSIKTGKQRPVRDMRELDWFKEALAPDCQDGTGWSRLRNFENLKNLDDKKGLSLYQKINSSSDPGELLGVLSMAVSVGWMRDHLVNSLGRHGLKSTAFIIDNDPADGTSRMMAHTDPVINKMLDDSPGPLSPWDCGDKATSAIATEIRGRRLNNFDPHQTRVHDGDQLYHVTYTCLRPETPHQWVLCHAIRDSEITNPARQRLATNLIVTLFILALALTPAILFSLRVAKPIEQLTSIAEATGRLELDDGNKIKSGIQEISQLAQAIESMRAGLKSFLRYIPEDLLRRYLRPGNIAGLDSEVVPVTIVFSDIRDFSSVAERAEPMTLVRHLNEYLEIISTVISRHGGTLDKYIGDAVMSFWNAPHRVPMHAREACASVLDAQQTLAVARARWESEGLPVFHTRVGIHTGDVIVGNIGSSVRLNYTIIGDAVNLTSRLEGLNKQYGTSILVSEPARQQAGAEFLTRPVDLVAVKGKTDPVLVHELMGWRAEATTESLELARLTAEAYAAYRAHRFTEARDAYTAISGRWPHDQLAMTMMERARDLILNPPREGWSGIHHASMK